MGCLPVAFPAIPVHAVMMKHFGVVEDPAVCQKVGMTANTIVLDHVHTFLPYLDYLWFPPQRENGGVPQSVLCLEVIFVHHIIMRNMTIVTVGFFPVRAVVPGGILGGHDMTVHTG
jgi:hypothetical protein